MEYPSSRPTFMPSEDLDDDQPSANLRNQALIIASFSIVLYSLVCGTACYYFRKFWLIEKEMADNAFNTGKYDHAKKLFFSILAVSSFLELPVYFGCLAQDGPTDCEWNSAGFVFFYYLHSIALCGYACCIVIPCVLWSDMINKKDGRLFFSSFPYDYFKRYLQALIILYFLNTLVEMLLEITNYRPSDPLDTFQSLEYSVSALLETILILALSIGCLYSGARLQVYVHDAKLNPTIEMKFLFSLNIIMFVIVLSFLGRAILVSTFAPGVPDSLHHPVNYAIFTLITRWTPDIFCQLCLIFIMRLSGKEIIAKNSKLNSSLSKSSQYSFFSFHFSASGTGATSPALKPLLLAGEEEYDGGEVEGGRESDYSSSHPSKDLAKVQENLLPVFKVSDHYYRKNPAILPPPASSAGSSLLSSSYEFRHEAFRSNNSDQAEEMAHQVIQMAQTPSEQFVLSSSHQDASSSALQRSPPPPLSNEERIRDSRDREEEEEQEEEGSYSFHDQRLLSM